MRPSGATARQSILVFNTNSIPLLEAVQETLGDRHEVQGTATVAEAIALIKKRRFDLLVTEVGAPDGVGLSLLEMARRGDPALGAVLVSDRQSLDDATKRPPRGPQASVAYPFTPAELKRAAEDALEQRQLLRDNKRLKALLPLFEISRALMSEVELRGLFAAILNIVWKETEADAISLMLLDETKQEFEVVAVLDPSQDWNDDKKQAAQCLASWVAQTATPLMLPQEITKGDLRRASSQMGVLSALCLPLVVKGKVIGVLLSSKRVGPPFTRSDLEFLSILCGQAAIAIENARLFDRAKTQQSRVKQLLEQVIIAQEQERQRISREIHDGVAQWMVGASYRLQALNKLLLNGEPQQYQKEAWEAKEVVDQSIDELRRVIFDLQPLDLTELGLVGALRRNLQKLERDSGITCSFRISGAARTLPSIVEITAYRVAQEALSNVRKHAQAATVKVALCFRDDHLFLEIKDDGKGFDLTKVRNCPMSEGHLGLNSMRDRAAALSGFVHIETGAGRGTIVTLTLPLESLVTGPLPAAQALTG